MVTRARIPPLLPLQSLAPDPLQPFDRYIRITEGRHAPLELRLQSVANSDRVPTSESPPHVRALAPLVHHPDSGVDVRARVASVRAVAGDPSVLGHSRAVVVPGMQVYARIGYASGILYLKQSQVILCEIRG